MCRAKKEENNGAAPLRSVSGEVFATFASLLLVALVLMCMLQTGLSCAYFAQERKSALTAVLDGATAMAETYASEGNIVTLPGGDNELVERAKTGFELFNTSSDTCVCGRPGWQHLDAHRQRCSRKCKDPAELAGRDGQRQGYLSYGYHGRYPAR